MDEMLEKLERVAARLTESISYVTLVVTSARERLCLVNDPANKLSSDSIKVLLIMLDRQLIDLKKNLEDAGNTMTVFKELFSKHELPPPLHEHWMNYFQSTELTKNRLEANVDKLQKEANEMFKTIQ